MKLKLCVVVALISVPAVAWAAPGDTLVGDPFMSNGYNNWVDPNNGVNPDQSTVLAGATVAKANWAVNLVTGSMQESSDGWFGEGTTTSGVADGKYTPYILINDGYTTPSTYSYSATLTSYDDDGFGVVFGYQGTGDYFRVGLRTQSNGNKGFGKGVSVQKVSGGVITSLGSSATFVPPVSTGPTTATPMNVKVDVDGANWAVSVDGVSILSGSDSSLAAGKVGLQSWYQKNAGTANAKFGVEANQVSVSDASGTLFQDSFTANLPVKWRSMTTTTNSTGGTLTGINALGGFRQNFRSGTISDDANGYTWATSTTPNIDFLSPSIVVDEAGSTSLTDYEMKVRLSNTDNDGIGVLVRVLDDKTFYRINFTAEADATTGNLYERAPTGMSIQKCLNGVWTELYRDDPTSADLWRYAPDGTPFDLTVRADGDQLFVQVVDNPDGTAVVKTYPIITDTNNPILAGSVGFSSWGNSGAAFSRYGGLEGTPLLIAIPEPASCMLACGLLGLALLRRRS